MTSSVSRKEKWYDVTKHPYNARGDGITDDTASIRAALTAAQDAGGGTVYFPPGTYYCNSVNRISVAGVTWLFAITGDNVTICGDGDASVISVDSAYATTIFFLCGFGKTNGASAWATNEYVDATVYTLTTAGIGDTSITLNTHADAGNFAAGDWIFIRTGQTIESASEGQPDSEINQVLTANAGTGVITLRWALAKPYAQEAVDTGAGYVYATKVGGAGANKPFGIALVNDRTIHDFTMRDMKLVSTSANSAINGGQLVGYTLDNVTFDLVASATSHGNIRHARIRDCSVKITAAGTWDYSWAPSTGCTDWVIEGTDCSSNSQTYLHIHEGVANYKAINNTIRNVYTGTDRNAVSIRGRAYDIQILDNTFVNAGPTILYVDTTCVGGGIVAGNRFDGDSANAMIVNSPNWTIGRNDNPRAMIVTQFHNWGGALATQYRDTYRLAGWVNYTDQTLTLGTIPATSAIIRVFLQVVEAFNSSTTDTISVGVAGAHEAYITATDVSTTGVKSPTLGTSIGWSTNSSSVEVLAYYVNGGTEPTTGAALVIVEYTHVPWRS